MLIIGSLAFDLWSAFLRGLLTNLGSHFFSTALRRNQFAPKNRSPDPAS